jgi:glycosyltransferase involved in cell wall biosynthesis
LKSRIIVNTRFEDRPVTGVERYAQEVLTIFGTEAGQIKPPQTLGAFRGHLWEQFQLPRLLNKGVVLWSPANTGPLAVKNQVLTLHDISPMDHPEWFQPSFSLWYRFLIPRLVGKVRHVITSSNFSKKRIIAKCGVSPERVVVIPGGVNQNKFSPQSESDIQETILRYSLPSPYFIAVGSLTMRKNILSLINIWSNYSHKVRDTALVIVGAGGAAFKSVEKEAYPPGVLLLGYVHDKDLPALYSGALALVFPSIYEGFGLPILEAMACGTPVIASNRTSIPEVVGEAGLTIDPQNQDALVNAVERVLASPELREQLRQAGFKRAASFSWNQTAERVMGVLLGVRGLVDGFTPQ